MSLVSVIIPNYNYSQFLREAIDSVLSQTYADIEIIVVDDGSTDGSKEVLDSYRDQIRVVFQQNQGVAATRNNGVGISNGEFIAFLDADDLWLPEKVEKQVSLLNGDSTVGLVHVGVMEIDGNSNMIATRLDGVDGDATQELLMLTDRGILGGGSGSMVARIAFDEVGGFDTRLSTSADWDLYYRISSTFRVGFIPEILLKYRVHNSNMHSNIERMERDMMTAFQKAFQNLTPKLAGIKRRAYANLHQNLAGSYFVAGNYSAFLRHSAKSLALDPGNIRHFRPFKKKRDVRT